MKNPFVLLIRNVAGEGFGGGEVYQLRLAEELKKHDFRPVIVSNSKELLRNAKRGGFEVLESPYLKQQNWSGWRNVLLPRYWWFQKKLKKWYLEVLKNYRPVAVNIQSRDDMIAGTLACKKMGVKVLWTDHADFRNWVLWNVNVKFKNVIGKKIIKLSGETEKVIFVSRKVEEETAKMIAPKELRNIEVVENGVEDERIKYKGIDEEKNSFVFVGRVTEEKGVAELVEAFKMVAEKHSEVTLNIYGDGELDEFKKKCDDCEGVKFYGKTDEPLKVLAKNEIFVLPSYREGLSLSLLEAAMMEKKIIASNVDGNMEVVTGGKTGLLVPAKSVKKLAEAMIWMLEHKNEADGMARNARKRYEEKFDFKKIFEEKMLPLYNGEKEKK